MVVSSGGISEQFSVLGMVVGFASITEGCGGKVNVEGTYQAALKRLMESASAKGADALLFVNFQNRVATSAGCGGAKQVFEVFAWGTAVKITKQV